MRGVVRREAVAYGNVSTRRRVASSRRAKARTTGGKAALVLTLLSASARREVSAADGASAGLG